VGKKKQQREVGKNGKSICLREGAGMKGTEMDLRVH
jgi:hypothetical protein